MFKSFVTFIYLLLDFAGLGIVDIRSFAVFSNFKVNFFIDFIHMYFITFVDLNYCLLG